MDFVDTWELAGVSKGKDEAEITETPKVGQDGTDGTIAFATASDHSQAHVIEEIANESSELFASMNLRAAESDYANGNIDDAWERLFWLYELLGSDGDLQSADDLGTTSMSREAIYSRVIALLRQIENGLDYFGQTEDFAPVLNIDYYDERLEELVDYAIEFDDLRLEFIDARDDARRQESILLKGIEIKQKAIEAARNSADTYIAKVDRLNNEVLDLSNVIARLYPRCIELSNELNEDIRAATNGCSMAEALSIVASVGTAVATIKTGGAAAIGAGTKLWKLGRIKEQGGLAALSALGDRIEQVGKVGGGVGKMAKGFAELQKALSRDPAALPPEPMDDNFDNGKLLQSRAELQQTLDPLRHQFSSAVELISAFDEFVETAITRNNKLLEGLHAKNLAWANLSKAEIALQEIDDLRSRLTRPRSSNVWFYGQFFDQSVRENHEILSHYYYLLSQAVDWWTGEESGGDYAGPDARWYRQALARVRFRLTRHLEIMGREEQRSKLEDRLDKYSLADDLSKEALRSLKETGTCIFSIPLDLVSQNRRLIRATGIRLSFTGLRENNNSRQGDPVRVVFSPVGAGQVVNLDGQVMHRHFQPGRTLYSVSTNDWSGRETSLGGSSRFTNPPLAGLWQLSILQDDMQRLRFKDSFDVTVEYTSSFLATNLEI